MVTKSRAHGEKALACGSAVRSDLRVGETRRSIDRERDGAR